MSNSSKLPLTTLSKLSHRPWSQIELEQQLSRLIPISNLAETISQCCNAKLLKVREIQPDTLIYHVNLDVLVQMQSEFIAQEVVTLVKTEAALQREIVEINTENWYGNLL